MCSAESPSHATCRRHLLLDSRIVASTRNAELALGSAEKHVANPLFGEDRPWEKRYDNLYANVLFDEDEQLYKVWYSPFIVDHSAKDLPREQWATTKYQAPYAREMGICYATSTDGLSWTKPSLGLVEYEGSRANNILWRGSGTTRAQKAGPHGAGIFKDGLDPNPARRFKALLKSEILSVAFSPDGIHWDAPIACRSANSAGDTHNNAIWAPTLRRYVGMTRQWSKTYQRQVARTLSEDFLTWDETELVLEGLDDRHHTYAMPIFFHADVYLGLLAIHDQVTDRVWTELAWSPDTVAWERIQPGMPFIPNADDEHAYDWGCVYAAAKPIFSDDAVHIYYGASDGLHTSWRNGYFCLATMRPDGFAGYRAASRSTSGIVTTTPILACETELCLSADIAEGGELVVRALSATDDVLAESRPLHGSCVDTRVNWLDATALHQLGEECASLQFSVRDATFYSFCLRTQGG